MKIEDILGNKCTGCSSCYNICPKDCISMEYNYEGFLYPQTNLDKCIECRLCEKVCPVIQSKEEKIEKQNIEEQKSFAGWSLDDSERSRSSSGGVFSLIAKYVLENNGYVFGACINEHYEVIHIGVNKVEELKKLQGSKYVQSKIGTVYKQVKEKLQLNVPVLFIGTPCQVAGLKGYLLKEYDNLYLIDFICHGVPSNKVLKRYIDYQVKKYSSKIRYSTINFRNKKYGWNNFSMSFDFENKEKYIYPNKEDMFFKIFLSDIALRKSCYQCKNKSVNKYSDLTLGDYWGIEELDNEFFNLSENKCITTIIVHSNKGEYILDKIKENSVLKEVNFNDIIKYNPSYYKSPDMHRERKDFYNKIDKYDIEKLLKKTIEKNVLFKIKDKILYFFRGNI